MTTQYAESHSPEVSKSLLLTQQLRINLLGLKQFEEQYILARWIRRLFTDILDRPNRPGTSTKSQNSVENTNRTLRDQQIAHSWESIMLDNSLLKGDGGSTCLLSAAGSTTTAQQGTNSEACFWPELESVPFLPNNFLPHVDFPSPNSFEYQGLQFMADLGFAGFDKTIDIP
jgi:hypothetical protein